MEIIKGDTERNLLKLNDGTPGGDTIKFNSNGLIENHHIILQNTAPHISDQFEILADGTEFKFRSAELDTTHEIKKTGAQLIQPVYYLVLLMS